jgi:hypothetical protein
MKEFINIPLAVVVIQAADFIAVFCDPVRLWGCFE